MFIHPALFWSYQQKCLGGGASRCYNSSIKLIAQRMQRLKRISAIIGVALSSALLAFPALAAGINTNIQPIASASGLGTADIRTIVGRIIYVALGVLGTVMLVIVVYAGFLWMTAGGNEQRVEDAKRYIKNASIGLAIILCSYAITYFVIAKLMGVRDSNGTGGPTNEQRITTGFGDYGDSSLGEGIMQSHYPAPGQTGVARNTKVIVTFKRAIAPETIIANGSLQNPGGGRPAVYTGTLNLANVRIAETANLAAGGIFATSSEKLVTEVNAYSADNTTFVFAPARYLGSPDANTSYTVGLGSGIMLADGTSPAFTGNFSSGYGWEFETGTFVDLTPPHVVSVMPSPLSTVARNIVIEITFSEGVDPTGATGVYTATNRNFSNVTVGDGTDRVEGTWLPSNQYRTIGFRTTVLGGTNSCGDAVYVLPGGATIVVNALAATVGDQRPQASFYPPDGITDLAGNSLDGNEDGTAVGQPADNVRWTFTTTQQLDLTPPRVDSTEPGPESGNADLSAPVKMVFSKPMSITTLTNDNLLFGSLPKLPIWYFGGGINLGEDGQPVSSYKDPVSRTAAVIEHARLSPTVGTCSDGLRKGNACAVDADCPAAVCSRTFFSYYPKATSRVTDSYQNCFLPACGTDATRRYCCPSAGGDVSCRTECATDSNSGALYCDESR